MSAVHVFENAQVLTVEGIRESFSVKDGRIFSLDSSPNEKNRVSVDLEGRCVVPGFIDSHTHMARLGREINGLSLEGIRSRSEALEKVKEYASRQDRDVVVGYGWDESLWSENEFLYSEDLGFTTKPVVLFRRDEHMAVVNEPVLRALEIPLHGDSSHGILKEEQMRPVREFIESGDTEIRAALDSAIGRAVSLGIVGVRDIVDWNTERVYSAMEKPIHVSRVIYDHQYFDGFERNSGRWGVKTFLDGSIGSLTAAHIGWEPDNLKFDRKSFMEHIGRFWKNGLPVAVHAIGEVAVETSVDVLNRSPERLVNSIEHFELVNEGVLDEIGPNTVVSSQPNFLMWAQRNGMYMHNLGEDWLGKNNPFREIVDRGIPLAFGSDCMPIGPVFGISQAEKSEFSNQRLSLREGIRAYTEGSASLLGLSDRKGRISKGFDADFVVMQPDFLSEQEDHGGMMPLETYINGVRVYSRDNMRNEA